MDQDQPLLICFCGPNGAGKSTLRRLTSGSVTSLPFINADEIALIRFGPGQAASKAYEAARLAEEERRRFLAEGRSFSFETVMSHPSKLEFLQEARQKGYRVVAHFVGLDGPATSRARVIQRVHAGGHDVPDDKIEARFPRVLDNLRRLLDIPDELVIHDNSSADDPFRLIARLQLGRLVGLSAAVPEWLAPLQLETRLTAQTARLP